jgi:hypothetical protein
VSEQHTTEARREDQPACCFGGYVTLTIEEDGEEYEVAVPCRRCNKTEG